MTTRRFLSSACGVLALVSFAGLGTRDVVAQDDPPAPTGVVGWGYSNQETAPALEIPPGLSDATAIAVGGDHALALRGDGSVVAWGGNDDGEATVPPDLAPVGAIAAGRFHSLALTLDGEVVGWGDDTDGAATPPDGLTGVRALAAGQGWSMVLQSDGSVVAWGGNSHGQTDVPDGLSGVIAIAAGRFHGLALQDDGSVVGWGGYFCTGAAGTQPDPLVPPGITGATAVAGGESHSLALLDDGTVVEWGPDGVNAPTDAPALGPPTGLTNVTDIAAGYFHSLALLADGSLVGWMTGTDDVGCSFDDGQAVIPDGLTDISDFGGGFLSSLAVVEATLPTVTRDPVDQTVSPGRPVTFGVAASAVPAASVQWESSVDGVDFTPIPGATALEHTFVASPSDDGALYRAVVSNAAGSVTSASARLTVIVVPAVLPETGSPQIAVSGLAGGALVVGLALVGVGRRRPAGATR